MAGATLQIRRRADDSLYANVLTLSSLPQDPTGLERNRSAVELRAQARRGVGVRTPSRHRAAIAIFAGSGRLRGARHRIALKITVADRIGVQFDRYAIGRKFSQGDLDLECVPARTALDLKLAEAQPAPVLLQLSLPVKDLLCLAGIVCHPSAQSIRLR